MKLTMTFELTETWKQDPARQCKECLHWTSPGREKSLLAAHVYEGPEGWEWYVFDPMDLQAHRPGKESTEAAAKAAAMRALRDLVAGRWSS